MKNQQEVNILPEDRIKLTKDQRNLITLALEKQLPPEDAKFLESIQHSKQEIANPYEKINNFYTKKYGSVFGRIYLAAITNGERACTEAINDIEKSNALKRMKREKRIS